MFEYATYNDVPLITYGLIGLTSGILALVTLNSDIVEIKENREQNTIANAIGLDKLKMTDNIKSFFNNENISYLPGINGLPQPLLGNKADYKKTVSSYEEDKEEDEDEEDENEEEASIVNPINKYKNPSGGRKTINRRKNIRKTKRKYE